MVCIGNSNGGLVDPVSHLPALEGKEAFALGLSSVACLVRLKRLESSCCGKTWLDWVCITEQVWKHCGFEVMSQHEVIR